MAMGEFTTSDDGCQCGYCQNLYENSISDIPLAQFGGNLKDGYKYEGPMNFLNHKFSVGSFIRPTKEGKYRDKGVMVYVTSIYSPMVDRSYLGNGALHDTQGVLISDSWPEGPECKLNSEDFQVVTDDELLAQQVRVKREKERIATEKLKTGDLVVLNHDMEFMERSQYSCGMITIRKGQSVVVDMSPTELSDDDDEEDKRIRNKMEPRYAKMGNYLLSDFISPRIGVFIPEIEQIEFIGIKDIERKTQEFKDVKLVVPPDYMDRLMTATRRVIDLDVHNHVYENLGLRNVCQKGRGSIILLYGPPGTGKTLTAEILAERIGRPLIKLTLGSLTDGSNLAKRLQDGFKRAKRYRAVLLLDEVDVFIRRRGTSNPIFDENTSVFLRVLEYFDGIMIMTTNLINMIDPAIFSRVHVCLEYGTQTKQERRAIWESMFPNELRGVLVGGDEALEKLFDSVSEYKLNGREIKTVIQNAITRAVVKHDKHGMGKDAIPTSGIKWISPKYFIEEAELLANQRDSLKGGM